MEKMDAKNFKKDLKEGLKYPWNKGRRLWNILWILVPIFGWLALVGYCKHIVRTLIKGERKELPKSRGVWKNFKEGVFVFVFMIPTFIVLGLINILPFFGDALATLVSIFLIPWLTMNFFMKETFDSLWEIRKAFNLVADNIKEYLYIMLKTLIYIVLYMVLSFVLIGLPALIFGRMYFLTEFYRRHK